MKLSEEVLCLKAIDDKLEWIRTKAGDEKNLADEALRGLRKVPSRSGSHNSAQQQSGYLGSGKVSGVMVPSAFGTQEMDEEDDEDTIPKKQLKVEGTVMLVSSEECEISANPVKEPMAVDAL